MKDSLLQFKGLSIDFKIANDWVNVTDGISFDVRKGETLALVGESGSGKSVTAMSVLGLLAPNARTNGTIEYNGMDLVSASASQLRSVRGRDIAMIFQEPMTALNPVYTIGAQLSDVLRRTESVPKASTKRESLRLMKAVHMPDPETKLNAYPHQLSGGQRQRAMIAMAISGSPRLLIADEPTTALDVTVQAEILDLLLELQTTSDMSMLLITHDMGVVADVAKRVVVMEKGSIVEQADVETLFVNPAKPYTKHLLASVPYLGKTLAPASAPNEAESRVLDVKKLSITYGGRSRKLDNHAVMDVSFDIRPGEILGLVGESGSGKTSIGKSIMGLVKDIDGDVVIDGKRVDYANRKQRRATLRRVSMVFQDPASSLNPRQPVWRSITDPLRWKQLQTRTTSLRDRAESLLNLVDMPSDTARRYPHELSGGQRQRIGIARALAVDPLLMIADEPTSALDVSVQATVLDLLQELQIKLGFACLFISHDLAVVELLADRVAVLQRGEIVELDNARTILATPNSDYTRRLIAAAPVPDPEEQRQRRRKRLTADVH
ncbi:dipeptide ABC transporter ATP-binding protein [Spelaeicoccus albus]|uniref:Peptide/nickel transport system ATP-binding protein n=1 Tax=Spelaeicoccus albus TaxID=1280376 RepID=A0A7Z0D4K1_9MICO|nr:ABC transporter ATP-binding protein [Spelaeicoccus albus]NYI68772.1 peptide/nickel transport system ATP-binding protein [Spelaeicoccus albus]